MNIIYKTPEESRSYVFDYTNFPEVQAVVPDLLAGASVSCSPSGLSIGGCSIPMDGQHAECSISGGTVGTSYTLTCDATTMAGATLSICGVLNCVAVLPN
jgi:hypothetical protein